MRLVEYCSVGVLLALLAGPATAKPDLVITTKAIEATVTIETALKAHPGLAADCLAEGRRWTESVRRDAEKALRERPADFRNGQHWMLEREHISRSVVGRYVSILRSDYGNTGAAHPNTSIDTVLWDRNAKKRISIRPFFKESADNGPTMSALAGLVRAAVATEKRANDAPVEEDLNKDPWLSSIKPQLLKLGPVTLAPSTEPGKSSGLTFHFQPFSVGPYAEGLYTAFVPWTEIMEFLSAEGLATFAGERPEEDAH
jgi:hypothetical protein